MKFEAGVKRRDKKGLNYEEAMKEAFSEIFENLREIGKDTKMQRKKADLEGRRESAPVTMLSGTTAAFKQPREILNRKLSAPIPPKSSLPKTLTRELSTPPPPKPSLSTIQWTLACFEEEEDM